MKCWKWWVPRMEIWGFYVVFHPLEEREPDTDPAALNSGVLIDAHMANMPERETPTMLLSGLTMRSEASRLKNRSLFSISRKYFALPANSPDFRPGAFHGVRSSSQLTPDITTKFAPCVAAIDSIHGCSDSFSFSGRMT